MTRHWMIAFLLFTLLPSCGTPPAAAIPPPAATAPSPPAKPVSSYQFVYQAVGNLVYQLDCMSGQGNCSHGIYKQLWQQLGTDPDDAERFKQWQTLRQKYSRQVVVDETPNLPLPIRFEGVDLWRKIRIAALNAESPEDYTQKLAQTMTYRDSLTMSQLLQHFWPRFNRWWEREAEPQVAVVEEVVARMDQAGLFRLIPQLQRFYEADLPPQATLGFHFMWRPKGESDGFFGEQLENHSVIELRAGQQLEYALGVVIHELCHYFFKGMPPDKQIALLQRFVNDADPDSLRAYNLLDEVVAATLGNGLTTQLLVSPERFQRYHQTPDSFYADPWIDPAAKALVKPLSTLLTQQQTLSSEGFFMVYLATLKQALPNMANHPILGLRTLGVVYDGSEGQDVAQHLQNQVHPGLTRSVNSLDSAQARQMFQQSSHLSGVLLVPRSALAKLSAWEPVLGSETIKELENLHTKHRGVVYGIQRNPKTHWFILLGEDQSMLKQLVDALLKSKQVFTGPAITM